MVMFTWLLASACVFNVAACHGHDSAHKKHSTPSKHHNKHKSKDMGPPPDEVHQIAAAMQGKAADPNAVSSAPGAQIKPLYGGQIQPQPGNQLGQMQQPMGSQYGRNPVQGNAAYNQLNPVANQYNRMPFGANSMGLQYPQPQKMAPLRPPAKGIPPNYLIPPPAKGVPPNYQAALDRNAYRPPVVLNGRYPGNGNQGNMNPYEKAMMAMNAREMEAMINEPIDWAAGDHEMEHMMSSVPECEPPADMQHLVNQPFPSGPGNAKPVAPCKTAVQIAPVQYAKPTQAAQGQAAPANKTTQNNQPSLNTSQTGTPSQNGSATPAAANGTENAKKANTQATQNSPPEPPQQKQATPGQQKVQAGLNGNKDTQNSPPQQKQTTPGQQNVQATQDSPLQLQQKQATPTQQNKTSNESTKPTPTPQPIASEDHSQAQQKQSTSSPQNKASADATKERPRDNHSQAQQKQSTSGPQNKASDDAAKQEPTIQLTSSDDHSQAQQKPSTSGDAAKQGPTVQPISSDNSSPLVDSEEKLTSGDGTVEIIADIPADAGSTGTRKSSQAVHPVKAKLRAVIAKRKKNKSH